MTEERSKPNGAKSPEQADDNKPQIAVQRIYVKDMSFESPEAPLSFNLQKAPEISVEINTKSRQLADEMYEVMLHVTVTAKHDDKVTYIAEVQQAGYFRIANIKEGSLGQALGAFCPNVLFPYVRTTLDSMMTQGSFPSLMLAPINFDALYAQNQMQKQQDEQNKAAAPEDDKAAAPEDDKVTVYQ